MALGAVCSRTEYNLPAGSTEIARQTVWHRVRGSHHRHMSVVYSESVFAQCRHVRNPGVFYQSNVRQRHMMLSPPILIPHNHDGPTCLQLHAKSPVRERALPICQVTSPPREANASLLTSIRRGLKDHSCSWDSSTDDDSESDDDFNVGLPWYDQDETISTCAPAGKFTSCITEISKRQWTGLKSFNSEYESTSGDLMFALEL